MVALSGTTEGRHTAVVLLGRSLSGTLSKVSFSVTLLSSRSPLCYDNNAAAPLECGYHNLPPSTAYFIELLAYLCTCKCDEEVYALVCVFPFTCTLESAQRCVAVVCVQL